MARATIGAEGLKLEGDLTLETVGTLESEVAEHLRAHVGPALPVDVTGVTRLDTAGALFLRRLPGLAAELEREVSVGEVPAPLRSFYAYVRLPAASPPAPPTRVRLWDRLGNRAEADVLRAYEFLLVMSDLTWASISALVRRRGIRRGSFLDQAVAVGADGLPIIALIIFLIGGVSTLQASAQLRQFGANILVADLLVIGITRELGPLMTAIVVAGRSGSAIAAEVATMKFTEELDALRTMALDPLRLVAVPKMWAMLLTVPLLTIMADFVGILGGTVTGVFSLDLSPTTFMNRAADALILKDIVTGLVKSVSFAWIITIIAVHRGLGFRGGAAGVGLATTSSVVASLFGIIVLDLIWGLVFYL
jgi:phospholipid/cholesterol/gamma-HCH transport system permease protein